ncbi:hypothetical protein GCM10011499_28030 [Pelagibacterium lentulum]|uniref:DUF1127 domain-containing protein n=1 Tax=Pelagibacterium lentulum TaxID=2029865 RepID=A0A916RJI8_9HYPH|nr:hypothetical protein GCM10011499_28030 [Pelagibacterium lentulum]
MAFLFGRSWGGKMRRSTLRDMMQMDSARLNDLGLTHFDIAEAMRHGGNAAGQILDARRSQRAAEWLR